MPSNIWIVTRGEYEDTEQLAAFTTSEDATSYRITRQTDDPGECFGIVTLTLFGPSEQPEAQTVHVRTCTVNADRDVNPLVATTYSYFDDRGEGPYPPVRHKIIYGASLPVERRGIRVEGTDEEQVERSYAELIEQARNEISAQ